MSAGFQICDSIGLAKQIAFHSEMVRALGLHILKMKVLRLTSRSPGCLCVCAGSPGSGEEEGAGKGQRETAGRAQQAEADREGDPLVDSSLAMGELFSLARAL